MSYPRCLRLGLIEAPWARGLRASSGRSYPRCLRLGLIEAALPPGGTSPPSAYPRCLRLGLIEASIRRKPYAARFNPIRGVYASASLKPLPPGHPLNQGESYPRCLRLGLIEATNRARFSESDCDLSEVFTPRPH